jgi:hypothetical protein
MALLSGVRLGPAGGGPPSLFLFVDPGVLRAAVGPGRLLESLVPYGLERVLRGEGIAALAVPVHFLPSGLRAGASLLSGVRSCPPGRVYRGDSYLGGVPYARWAGFLSQGGLDDAGLAALCGEPERVGEAALAMVGAHLADGGRVGCALRNVGDRLYTCRLGFGGPLLWFRAGWGSPLEGLFDRIGPEKVRGALRAGRDGTAEATFYACRSARRPCGTARFPLEALGDFTVCDAEARVMANTLLAERILGSTPAWSAAFPCAAWTCRGSVRTAVGWDLEDILEGRLPGSLLLRG